MLRRLARRYGEEEHGDEGSGDGHGRDFPKTRADDLGLDLDDEEDETERWIIGAEAASAYDRSMGVDARAAGRRVWVPAEDAVWRIAQVSGENADGSSYTVLTADGKGEVEIPIADCVDYDPTHSLDLADASRMNQMHEGPLLDLLDRRFRANNIYTDVADVLVSINPYTDIPGLYDIPMPVVKPPTPVIPGVRGPSPGSRVAERTAALMRGYGEDGRKGAAHPVAGGGRRPWDKKEKGAAGGGGSKESDSKLKLTALKGVLGKPHVYGVADRAFQYMAETRGREVNGRIRKRNQSILITGESGAGKTEASKHVMRFLITASRALASTMPPSPSPSSGPAPTTRGRSPSYPRRSVSAATSAAAAAKHMEDVLLRSNTVLEAFGNAKTVRNDNSSRFGKYIKLQYDEDFCLVGARTEHFLLEKSRLVHLEKNERSYHILYQVAKALPEEARDELNLNGGAESFTLLNQGNCLEASDDVDDREEFRAVDRALSSLEFSISDKRDTWRLVAAILHSGEVRFEDVPGKEQCRIKSGRAGGSLTPTALASLWGVDQKVFEAGVMRRTVTAGGTSASVALNAAQARDNLLALLKHMYRQLFAWINWKINVVFDVPGSVGGGKEGEHTFIGILDIFGFEIMTTNSFEQLCINFANEVLQKQFNHHIFVLEQEEYGAEGLDVASIPFRDNQRIIDLIAKRPAGLMPILEDQALTGRQAASLRASFTDKNLLDLFHQQHHRKAPHPCYRKPRFEGPEFVVMHYAGDVTYCATGFLEKNNDTLQEDLRGLLLSSRIPFLRQLILGDGRTFEQEEPASTVSSDSPPNGCRSRSRAGGSSSLRPNDEAALPAKETQLANGDHRNWLSSISKRVIYSNGDSALGNGGLHPSASPPRCSTQPTSALTPFADLPLGGRPLRRVASAKMAAQRTVSNAFRRQLDELVVQLGDTEPHYIKCIKPNSAKTPGGWSSSLVIKQLRYSGVLEVVRIRREAFPMRITYKHFYRRFGNLVSLKDKRMPLVEDITLKQAKIAGLEICETVFGTKGAGAAFETGKTKIFLRDDGLKTLRMALRQHYFDLATRIQALWRGVAERIRFARWQQAVGKLQRLVRGRIARRRYQEVRRAAIILQAVARMHNQRRVTARRHGAAVQMQAAWRGWRQRGWLKRNDGAVRMQAVARGFVTRKRREKKKAEAAFQVRVAPIVRGFLARRRYEKCKTGIVTLQAAARGVSTRKVLAEEARTRAVAKVSKQDGTATLVAVAARTIIARGSFQRKRASALRVQTTIRAFLRNRRLRNRSIDVFDAARLGDVPAVARHLSEWPELLFIRNCHDSDASETGTPSYGSLLHAACKGGATDVAVLLEPFPSDVTAVDRWGNTSIHFAATACDYEALKFLAHRANLDVGQALRSAANGLPAPEPEAFPLGMSKEAFSLAAAMVRRLRLSEAAAPPTRARGKAILERKKHVHSPEGSWVGTPDGEAWVGGRPMVQGFLRKRRETDRWLKRWCQLKQYTPPGGGAGETGPALFYFKKKTDTAPSKVITLQHCLLKRSEHISFAFELHSPLMLGGRNNEGRLYFQAADEQDLQRWMVPLRVLVMFVDIKNERRKFPMEFLDLDRRRQLVRATNHMGETPLHLATAFTVGDAPISTRYEVTCAVQNIATWLVENGADPNTYNAKGETPMHVTAKAGHASIVPELEKRGGDPNLPKVRDGKTPEAMATESVELGQFLRTEMAPKVTAISYSSGVTDDPLLPSPCKVFGFTYISMFLEKLTLASTMGVAKPILTLSVVNARGQLVEASQDMTTPALASTNYLWWAQTWHMHTPLETLGSGSMVVFELRDVQAAERKVVCWGALPLDQNLLNTQSELLSTYLPPTDPARLSTGIGSVGCYGITGGVSLEQGDFPPPAKASLGADVFLTRAVH